MSLCPQTGSLKLLRDVFNDELREGLGTQGSPLRMLGCLWPKPVFSDWVKKEWLG